MVSRQRGVRGWRRHLANLGWILTVAGLAAGPARAEGGSIVPPAYPLTAPMYDIGGIYSFQDFGFPEGPVTLFGVRVRERGAGLGRMALGAVFMLLGSASEAAASTVGEYRGSTYSQDLSGNVYRTDHYQRASPEELARMRESRDEGFDAIMSAPMSMDLQLFFGGANGASGISFEITPFTVGLLAKGRVGFEVAFAYTLLRDHAALGERERQYQNLGVPIRLMANFSWLQLALQWTPNIFGSFGGNAQKVVDDYRASVTSDPTTPITYRTSPLSLAVTLTPLKYIFIRATGTINRWDWSTRVLGYSLELGVRL